MKANVLCACLPVVPEWSLDQDSVLRYQLRGGGSPRRTQAQLLLRTRASTGTLLSTTSRDGSEYIILEVSPNLETHTRTHTHARTRARTHARTHAQM